MDEILEQIDSGFRLFVLYAFVIAVSPIAIGNMIYQQIRWG
jgi:hypothetical protein